VSGIPCGNPPHETAPGSKPSTRMHAIWTSTAPRGSSASGRS